MLEGSVAQWSSITLFVAGCHHCGCADAAIVFQERGPGKSASRIPRYLRLVMQLLERTREPTQVQSILAAVPDDVVGSEAWSDVMHWMQDGNVAALERALEFHCPPLSSPKDCDTSSGSFADPGADSGVAASGGIGANARQHLCTPRPRLRQLAANAGRCCAAHEHQDNSGAGLCALMCSDTVSGDCSSDAAA